jgi:3-hydroxybutyryl-CoA dehydrogenase
LRDSILIVGSGVMGCGIAAYSALAGNKTILLCTRPGSLENALPKVKSNINEYFTQGLCSGETAEKAITLVEAMLDMPEACEKAAVVIESIIENLAAKQNLFEELDALLPPEIPILSNTSGLRITDIAEKTKYPQRTLTTHFWLPAHLIPLVEVVIGDHSSPELAVIIRDMLKKWGKSPVIVKKDLPGQLANRILQAIIREAVNIVEIGLASAEDVDTAIKMGMALRFPVWGPLEHVDAVGIDLCRSVQNTVLPEITSCKAASPLFDKLLEENNLGYKAGNGFYDWSNKDMGELVKRRNEFIVYALKKIRNQ